MSDPTPAPSPVPAGWYPDPEGGSRRRWWDGNGWTSNFEQPYAQGAAVTGASSLTAPAGTTTSTPWIWLIVLLPLVNLLSLFATDWSSLTSMITDPSLGTDPTAGLQSQLELYTSPAFLLSTLGGYVVTALMIWFAYLDVVTLRRREVPQPFPWPWMFTALAVGPLVYVIGRSVVVRRRTGGGLAPLWAAIGVTVVGWVVSGIVIGSVITSVLDQLPSYLVTP